MSNKIHPINLKNTARVIAKNYKDKGAIIITLGDEGVRIGTHGLSAKEMQEALCLAINYSFCSAE